MMKKISLIALVCIVALLPLSGSAIDHVTMSLENPSSTSNTLEFDVYIVNDGTTLLKLGGYQFGVNFSASILNGGTPTGTAYSYVAGTRDPVFALLTNPSLLYGNNQLKAVSTTVPSVSATNLPIGTPYRLGRFRFTNTVNWTTSSLPNLSLQLPSANGKVQCVAACFLGSNTTSTPLSNPVTVSNPVSTLDGVTNFTGFALNFPTPVILSSFEGNKSGTYDILTWTTSQEQNNDYFNLQHSADGIHFSTIEKINSGSEKGNSQVKLSYSATHIAPVAGHNYYRLVQVDIDGHTTIETRVLDLIRLTNDTKAFIFPNPTDNILNVQFETGGIQNVSIKLIDLTGHVVKTVQTNSNIGTNTLSCDMQDLTSGVYFVQLFENNILTFTDKVRKNK